MKSLSIIVYQIISGISGRLSFLFKLKQKLGPTFKLIRACRKSFKIINLNHRNFVSFDHILSDL